MSTSSSANGFVASLAHPGGNITGLYSLTADLSGKRLELLKEILSKLFRVAVSGTSTNYGNIQSLEETEPTAAFGVMLHYLDILGPKDIDTAFQAAVQARADTLFVLRGPVLNSHRAQVAELAIKNRLPATYERVCGRRRAHELRREP